MRKIVLRPDRVGYLKGTLNGWHRDLLALHVMREDQLRPDRNVSVCAIDLDTLMTLEVYSFDKTVKVCLHCVNVERTSVHNYQPAKARINGFGMVEIFHPGSFLRIKLGQKIMIEVT